MAHTCSGIMLDETRYRIRGTGSLRIIDSMVTKIVEFDNMQLELYKTREEKRAWVAGLVCRKWNITVTMMVR